MQDWLTVPELARLASISQQKARLALSKALKGNTWRRQVLIVRLSHGRGGLSGHSYEVRVDSLPTELAQAWQELSGPVEAPLKVDNATVAVCQWRHALIRPALAAAKRSPERAAIVKDVAGREHVTPKGRRERVGERTLQRWIDAFEQPAPHGGFAALMRKKRADHGEAAVIVTRAWDRAVTLDEAAKYQVAHDLRQYVRGLLKAGESLSYGFRVSDSDWMGFHRCGSRVSVGSHWRASPWHAFGII